jgi:diketogulonate reductase-like aldo/keto reductase
MQSSIVLANGIRMPRLGFGTWQFDTNQARQFVGEAIAAGYRHIDTAAAYGNERGVGQAVATSGVARDKFFITTKLHDMEGYEHTLQQCHASLERLGLDYIDLYLIHWPFDGVTPETWRGLERLYDDKLVRAIGVCNFSVERLRQLLAVAQVKPMVNQVELHPFLTQRQLRDFCARQKILVESWSPLMQGGELLQHPFLRAIAEAHGKSTAQIVLRWHLQHGLVAIPKSSSPERMRQNLAVFDFSLTSAEMTDIDSLNQDRRANPVADPDSFVFTKDIYDRLQRIND